MTQHKDKPNLYHPSTQPETNPFNILSEDIESDDIAINNKIIVSKPNIIVKPEKISTKKPIISSSYADKVKAFTIGPTDNITDVSTIASTDILTCPVEPETKNINTNTNTNTNTNINFDMFDNTNNKKILCYNMINTSKCNYGSKCVYAHSLKEQKLDDNRIIAYELISGEKKFTSDIYENKDLMKILFILTSICQQCIKKICPGGYNCKYGVFDIKNRICYTNLISYANPTKGFCNDNLCSKIHLIKKPDKPKSPTNDVLNTPNIRKPDTKIILTNKHDLNGILLDENFFLNINKNKYLHNDNNYDSDSSDQSEDLNESTKSAIIDYLNTISDDDYEESIFIYKNSVAKTNSI